VEEARQNRQRRRLSLKISSIYAVVGALWIFFSDRVAAVFSNTPQDLAQIETIKGWLFVLLTALLLYNLVSRGVKRLEVSQEAFLESEEKYRALVETTETGYAILDHQGKVLDANVHYAKLTGHNTLQEILGRSVTEWTAAYDVERITEEVSKCREENFTRRLRIDYMDKSGNIIPVEMNSTSIHSAEGTVILALCVDINERKRAEDALKESELRFRTIFEHTAVGVAQVDSHTGRFVRINKKFCDIVGYSPVEMLGRDFQSITHPGDLETSLNNNARLVAGEVNSYTMEKRYIHRNGAIVWVNLTISALWATGEKQDFHVAVVEDITERKRAEEKLKEYEKVVEGVDEMIVVIDRDYRYLIANRAFLNYRELEREQVVGRLVAEILDKEVFEKVVKKKLDECFEGNVIRYEMKYNFPNLGERDLFISYFPIEGPAGVDRAACVFQDITERKRAGELLQQSNARISHLNDVLHAIRDVGRLINSEKNPIELLNAVCHSLVQTRGYVMVWIGIPDADSKGLVPVAHSGGGADFIQHAPIAWDNSPAGQGPAVTAMRERRAVVFDDPAADSHLTLWDDPVMTHGCASSASVPLIHEERLFGVLTVKADRRHAFDPEDVELLSSLAADLARALQSLENEVARERAEKALRGSEKKFRLIFEMSPDSVNLNRASDGKYIDINENFTKATGYTREEVTSAESTIESIIWNDPEDRKRLADALRSTGVVQNMEAIFRAKDGTVRMGLLSARLLRIDRENVILSITRDITERKRAEAALRESEELYRTLVSLSPDAISVVDQDGLLTFASPRARQTFGHSPDEEILGRSLLSWVAPEEQEKATANIAHLMGEGTLTDTEYTLMRKDGTRFFGECNAAVIHSPEGSPMRMIIVTRDITERKRAEEERRRLEDRLQRAEKMEALGTLAGGVAHDLNNVLGIVVGYSELLTNDSHASSSTRSRANEILKGGQRAAAIVQDLLTLARRGVSNRKVLNLNHIVLECRNSPEFAGVFSYHPNTRIETDLEEHLLNISGSAVHLGKSLMNLVSNAAEAMPNGGEITIKTRNRYLDKPVSGYDEVREGDYVVLSVSDTGEGIPAGDLKRIFEPFYTKKVMGRSGTGLGTGCHLGYSQGSSGIYQCGESGRQRNHFHPLCSCDKRGNIPGAGCHIRC
jgi:PAS domain S-box-containing protein